MQKIKQNTCFNVLWWVMYQIISWHINFLEVSAGCLTTAHSQQRAADTAANCLFVSKPNATC